MNFFSHSTAIIDEGAIIGENTNIWHWTHISSGAKIGSNCNIGQGVYISSHGEIGSNVKIQNNVSIFDQVIIEDNVFCGPSAVFTNVKNPRAFINRKNEYQETLVQTGATIGANATIICGVTIGRFSFIGAGALINKNVPDFAIMTGVPAKISGWIGEYGSRLELKDKDKNLFICPYSHDEYIISNNKCIKVEKD